MLSGLRVFPESLPGWVLGRSILTLGVHALKEPSLGCTAAPGEAALGPDLARVPPHCLGSPRIAVWLYTAGLRPAAPGTALSGFSVHSCDPTPQPERAWNNSWSTCLRQAVRSTLPQWVWRRVKGFFVCLFCFALFFNALKNQDLYRDKVLSGARDEVGQEGSL